MTNPYPTNIPAERAVIGACLIDPDAIGRLLPDPTMFYKAEHQQLVQAMLDLNARQEPIDLLTIEDQLERNATPIPPAYVLDLIATTPTSLNATSYLTMVVEASARRAYMQGAQTVVDLAVDPTITIADLQAKAQAAVTLPQYQRRAKTVEIQDHIREAIDQLQVSSTQATPNGVLSGLNNLDEITTGFAPGDLVILAGRPGMGKTAFALNLAANITQRNRRVAFFSMEMTSIQCVHRLIALLTGIPTDRLRMGLSEDEEWQTVLAAANDIYGWNMYLDDTPGLDVDTFVAQTRVLHAQNPLSIILVDYLQLFHANTGNRQANREQVIGYIADRLKTAAKEMGVPIIALSQLSRAVETRANKRPMLSDLRESGTIEQFADLVVFLYRDSYYNPDSEIPGVTEAIVAKHRNGRTGTVPLYWDGARGAFRDLEILRTDLAY
jgi:replicative DNA helicase